MFTLKNNKIDLDWTLAYVGVINNWLTPNDVLSYISSESLSKLNNEVLSELYIIVDENKIDFLNFLKKLDRITDEKFKIGEWVWSISFLIDIYKSNKLVPDKLKDIEMIWAMFNYPKDWENFIYYLPVSEDKEVGVDRVYERFVSFLEIKKSKLRRFGYIK